jgi:chromosome segregation ATPase
MPQTAVLPLPTPPATTTHVAELERELQEISAELANSIKREMELEDELERYKLESSSVNIDPNRRTSDYYSDCGAGSVKYSLGDSEGRIEELERLRRKAEQDKAQVKLDMSQRLEDALRTKRQVEERLSSPESGSPKLRQLEAALEEARRKLKEERQSRETYESLIASMKIELVQRQNESENLRDEVVPQLKARIEGLENESADKQKLVYENSRMQQELEKLRNEHETFMSARRMQIEMQKQQDRMISISEDNVPLSMQPGLSRTKSLAAKTRGRANSTSSRSGSTRENTGTLSRSNSIREQTTESREVLTQSLRDIEAQRAALHSALKSLILRQTHMEKQHAKRIKALEQEKDKVTNLTPQRSTFQREVRNLREEVVDLRRRADEALEQKWRCENGLSGLKMDLDRAQQETNSLRQLLQERDIFVPERPASRSGRTLDPETPGSLDKAYKELRTTHALSIASIQALEAQDSLGIATTEAEKTLELLKKSISDAEAERNLAQKQAAQYRDEARKLQRSELEHLSKEQSLASELYASAQRMDELASQVQTQLQANSLLRQRLAEAIGRGEQEQKSSATRIAQMQGRLRELEDQLMVAQQHSEQAVANHEEEVRQLHEAHNAQLKRAKLGMSPSSTAPPSPLNPLVSMKSPRISRTTSGNGMTFSEATRTGYLENRVKELEKALTDADREMGEVVQRMNSAQIEVAELQSERYVKRCTHQLPSTVVDEKTTVGKQQHFHRRNWSAHIFGLGTMP